MGGETSNGTVFDVHGDATRPPLILIHGLGLTRATWDGFIPDLAAHHCVVTYDLIGHGDSASNAPIGMPVTLSSYSDQLIELLDHLSISRATLVGFSLGGMINRRVAMDHPERVAALVILNSPHRRTDADQELVEARAKASADDGPAATLDAAITRWFSPAFIADHPGVIAQTRKTLLANDKRAYADARWVLANGVRELIHPDPPITKPTLIMTAEHDTGSTPAMSHEIAAEISGSTCTIVPALQHMALLEKPDVFLSEICSFLARLEA